MKRVLNKEKLDKQLTGQASNISPFMKMRDNTNSSQKVLMKSQDLEAVTLMMYNMSLQQGKTKKTIQAPRFIRKVEEVKDKTMIEIDLEITIGKDKVLYKMDIPKISVEMMAEIEVGLSFNRSCSSDRSRSRERSLSPRRYNNNNNNNNNNNRQNDNSRFRSRSRSISNSRITRNRHRIRCYKCWEYDHFAKNVQTLSQVILMVMSKIRQP